MEREDGELEDGELDDDDEAPPNTYSAAPEEKQQAPGLHGDVDYRMQDIDYRTGDGHDIDYRHQQDMPSKSASGVSDDRGSHGYGEFETHGQGK